MDLNIRINTLDAYVHGSAQLNRFDELFQIKSLKRMKIYESNVGSLYTPAKIPTCHGLELLYMNSRFSALALTKMLQVSLSESECIK